MKKKYINNVNYSRVDCDTSDAHNILQSMTDIVSLIFAASIVMHTLKFFENETPKDYKDYIDNCWRAQ